MIDLIVTYASLAIILLIAIGLHEYAHAYVSYRLGDPTPKLQGRLTMNPLKHIDVVGFLMIFLIGFGWGKPVQINPSYYKNPVKGEFLVAFAGPIMNLLLATIGIILMLIVAKFAGLGVNDIYLGNFGYVEQFLLMFSMLNIGLAVFNLIPIPPLDGFRIVKIISVKFATMIEQYTRYIMIGLVLVVLLGQNQIGGFLSTVSEGIFRFLFSILANIFY